MKTTVHEGRRGRGETRPSSCLQGCEGMQLLGKAARQPLPRLHVEGPQGPACPLLRVLVPTPKRNEHVCAHGNTHQCPQQHYYFY